MRLTPRTFLLLIAVVLAAVFACYEFYRLPAGSGATGANGQLGASHAATGSVSRGTRSPRTSTKKPGAGGRRRNSGFVPLSPSVVDGVEKFVLFVGYPRSAHSIIGSMMDAHPNMVISHEYDLVERCVNPSKGPFPKTKSTIFNALYSNSYKMARGGVRTEKNTSKGYDLHVPTPWQGGFTHLRVIGDKGGGSMAIMFSEHHQEAKVCLQAIMDIILRLPIIFFHVVRNPYDMITTGVFHATSHQFNMRAKDLTMLKPSDEDVKVYADKIFRHATAVTRVMELTKVVEIHTDDFVADPRKTVRGICNTLSLPCPEQYVETCYERTYRNASKSRYNMEWSPAMLQYVGNNMRNFSFFSRYTFD